MHIGRIRAEPSSAMSVLFGYGALEDMPARKSYLVVSGFGREDRITGFILVLAEGNFYVPCQHGLSEKIFDDAVKLVAGACEVTGSLPEGKGCLVLKDIKDRFVVLSTEKLTEVAENLATALVASQFAGPAAPASVAGKAALRV